jgi:hypothetical protein
LPVSAAERWPVMRELYETGVAVEDLAILTSLTVRAILQRAAREGWGVPGEGDAVRFERIRDARERVLAEVDAAMAEGGESGLDKARIETAAAAMKILERLMESERALLLARQQAERARQAEREAAERARAQAAAMEEDAESARENQERRDAEIAEVLQSIDAQIVTLAKGYARELAAKEEGRAEGRTDPR